MKILWGSKDGGPESNVRMWGIESKHFGSVLLLSFAEGSREAFHAHAFSAVSWLLSGCLIEQVRTRRTSTCRRCARSARRQTACTRCTASPTAASC